MSKTVVAIFEERDFAEKAARDIKNQGLRTDDISLLARERERDSEGITEYTEQKVHTIRSF